MNTVEILIPALISIACIVIGGIKFRNAKMQGKGKKKWVILIAFGVLSIMGMIMPQPEHREITQPEATQAPAPESAPKVEPEQASSSLICTVPGLGDTLEAFEAQHPTHTKGDISETFKDGYSVIYLNDRIQGITIPKNNNGSMNENIKSMLPRDAKKTGAYTKNDGVTKDDVITYHSDSIANVFPKSEGNLNRMDIYDPQTEKYIDTVIECIPSKQK